MFRILASIVTLISFLITSITGTGISTAFASDEYHLPAPGVMVHLSPPLDPPILKGIKVHPDNPFRFDFILDKGDSLPLVGRAREGDLKQEATKLIKYFLASLTIPEKDLWVNLSPYEKDRIIPNSFGLTEMGRDLLAEDYMLKQITASLIYPEDAVGKKFWKRVYEEAAKKYGTTNIPVDTFNKVWIVPEKAIVYENAKAGTAYVVESKLKVMLEQDYLSLEKHMNNNSLPLAGRVREGDIKVNSPPPSLPHQGGGINGLGSQIVREIVIPQLTREVNENKNFAHLRQIYNSLILATWYKKKIKQSILAQVYADKNKVAGVNIDDPKENERIYQKYLRAFKKGVFNYIKEETDPISQETIPRKYFSGGVQLSDLALKTANVMQYIENISSSHFFWNRGNEFEIKADLAMATSDQAMMINRPNMNALEKEVLRLKNILIEINSNSPFQRELHLHGTNAQAMEGILEVGGKLLPGDEVRKRGINIFSGESFGTTPLNRISVSTTDLGEFLTTLRYANFASGRSKVSFGSKEIEIMRNGPDNIDENIETVQGMIEKGQENIKSFQDEDDQWYYGNAFQNANEKYKRKLVIMQELKKYFNSLTDNERERIMINSKIRVIVLGYDSGTKKIKLDLTGSFSQKAVQELTIETVATDDNDIKYVRNMVKHSRRPDINVVSIEDLREISRMLDRAMTEQVVHVTSINFLGSILSNGFINTVGTRTFLSANESYPTYGDMNRITVIWDIPQDLIAKDKVYGHSWVLTGKGESEINEDAVIKKMGIEWVTKYKRVSREKTFGVISSRHINIRETIERNQARVKEGELDVNVFNQMVQELEVFEKTIGSPSQESPSQAEDRAMIEGINKNTGGIDLTPAHMNVQTQNNGGEIKFRMDAAMLQRMQNAPGFLPEIIDIQPMNNLRKFLEA